MKTNTIAKVLLLSGLLFATMACKNSNAGESAAASQSESAALAGGQSNVKDDVSQANVVKVAANSPDHTTLVKAVVAAELLDVLSNAGPFTVFAPTNAAFDALPKGTLDDLLKPENKAKLQDILQYHVTTSSLRTDFFTDGMTLSMANGGKATITVKDGKVQINGANILGSVPASNGMVHVIDAVILPK